MILDVGVAPVNQLKALERYNLMNVLRIGDSCILINKFAILKQLL